MIRSLTAALAITGATLMTPALASVASAAPASAEPIVCHSAKCELHRTESRAHIPHHIHNGIRW